MRIFKILSGVTFLILTFILATASSLKEIKPKIVTFEISPEEILIEKKNTKTYNKRKQELYDELQMYFNKAIQAGEIVGAGVSIVKGDSIVIASGFGKRSIGTKDKVDGQTVFRLGSLSKGFAGVLAANLNAEGKLSWNDKITDYIPEFQLGDQDNTGEIRLKHILSHTSGAAYHSYTNLIEAGISVADIAKQFNKVNPVSKPGQQYSYQNAMFSLSQEVMREVTGKDAKTLLQNRFFKPLCMETVSMNDKDLIENKNIAIPHIRKTRGWKALTLNNHYYNAVTAGGINASSVDMGKWMRFLLGHNPEVMKVSHIRQVFEPRITFKNNRKYYQRWPGHLQSSYGFGWRIHQMEESGYPQRLYGMAPRRKRK